MSRVELAYCIAVTIITFVLMAIMAVELDQDRPTGWIDFPAVGLAALFPVGICLRIIYRRSVMFSIVTAFIAVSGLWFIVFGAAALQGHWDLRILQAFS